MILFYIKDDFTLEKSEQSEINSCFKLLGHNKMEWDRDYKAKASTKGPRIAQWLRMPA